MALEAHDLAYMKLEHSNETLTHRFEREMQPYITGKTPTWHQITLSMWIDACWPGQR